jgi:hypothetical protein
LPLGVDVLVDAREEDVFLVALLALRDLEVVVVRRAEVFLRVVDVVLFLPPLDVVFDLDLTGALDLRELDPLLEGLTIVFEVPLFGELLVEDDSDELSSDSIEELPSVLLAEGLR